MGIEDIYERFGELIKKRRNIMQLTQDELAKKVRLSRASIANIESGRQKIMLHQVYLFAKSLNLEPIDLLADITMSAKSTALPAGSSHGDQLWVDAILRQVKNA